MLFKILHGDESNISLDVTPFHEGWCYVTHDGYFYVDLNIGTTESPNNQRLKLNAKDCESVLGLTLEEIQKSISWNDLLDKPELGTLASKSEVSKTDLSQDVQASLNNANTALQSSDLDSAINNALTQAKESGEFNGADGHTPVKGEDYCTEEDKAEMVGLVLAALPNAEEVSV